MPEFWQGYVWGEISGALLCILVILMLRVHLNIHVRVRRNSIPAPPPVHTWEMTTEEKAPPNDRTEQ